MFLKAPVGGLSVFVPVNTFLGKQLKTLVITHNYPSSSLSDADNDV